MLRVAAVTIGVQRGLELPERRGHLKPFLTSLGPADIFAVFEPPPAYCSSPHNVAHALGAGNHTVLLHYLTADEDTDARLRIRGMCCGNLMQYHKLAIALRMVRERERAIGEYGFIIKWRHDLVEPVPLHTSWRSSIRARTVFAYHDVMLVGSREDLIRLGDVWENQVAGVLASFPAGNMRVYSPINWTRLVADLHEWPTACSNYFDVIDWPAAFVKQLGRKPTVADVARSAAALQLYATTNRTVQYTPWLLDGWPKSVIGWKLSHVIDPELLLGNGLAYGHGGGEIRLLCIDRARGLFASKPARHWRHVPADRRMCGTYRSEVVNITGSSQPTGLSRQ